MAASRPFNDLPGSWMTELDMVLSELKAHEGVEHLLLVGRDGLLVRDIAGDNPVGRDAVAAMIPGFATGCAALGQATGQGAFTMGVVEFGGGVVIVATVSADVFLGAILRPGVGFAPFLRALRAERERLASHL